MFTPQRFYTRRPVSVAAVTWDPTAKNTNAVLSNGNLTATSGIALHQGGRTATVIGSGVKRYWEITVTDSGAPSSNDSGVGICNASMGFADGAFIGSTTNGVSWYCGGDVYFNSAVALSIGSWAATVTLCLAVDGGNKIWWRNGAGNWNNSGADNPATNTGGYDVSAMGGVYPTFCVRNSGAMTANFGATAFSQTPPSGFAGF